MFEANYPERTKRIIVVRAPKVFPMAYNLIKPFMDEVTREKVVVLGSESILEIIESFCVLCWNSHVQFQTTGRKGYKSTSVQTSSPRLMVEPDVSQILTAQTTWVLCCCFLWMSGFICPFVPIVCWLYRSTREVTYQRSTTWLTWQRPVEKRWRELSLAEEGHANLSFRSVTLVPYWGGSLSVLTMMSALAGTSRK